MAASHRLALKSARPLIEKALNCVIADGFAPHGLVDPNAANAAVRECARRFDFGIGIDQVVALIEKGDIRQNDKLFHADDPHHELRRHFLDAGIEAAGDKQVRHRLLVLSDEVKKLNKLLEKADRREITAEAVRTKIYGLKATPPIVPARLATPRLPKGSPGVPMIDLCDWHYGEVTTLAESRGFNECDIKTMDRRIDTLTRETIRACQFDSPKMDYPGIVVCMAGDFFTGDGLHPELDSTNEKRTIEIFSLLQGRLIHLLRAFADAFGQVYVVAVIGNHARNTPKPVTKNVAATNYEFLLYNQLELFFAHDPRYKDKIAFNIPLSIGTSFVVGADPKSNYPGHRYYVTHGERMGAKGGRGIIGVIGPIVRGALNIKRIEEKRGKPVGTVVIGHYHDPNQTSDVIAGGTLKGVDGFSLDVVGATPKPPSQELWFNHKRYGPIEHHQIIVDELKNPKDGSDSPTVFPAPRRGGGPKKKPPGAAFDFAA